MSDTPILDRERPLPTVKRKFKVWYGLLLGAVIGGFLAAFTDADAPPDPPALDAWILAYALAALYFGVLVHELGHLVAGFSVGFNLRLFAVGPLFLIRQAQGWRLQFKPAHTGGLTGMTPQNSDRLVERYLRFTLGGPAASIVLLLIALVLFWRFPDSIALRTLLLVDLFLIAMCCIPFVVRGASTDAKKIQLLTRKGPAAEQFAAILYIMALDAQKVEPHDWPRELVDKLDMPTDDNSHRGSLVLLLSNVAADSGDAEWSAREIEHGLALHAELRPDFQRAFQVSAACCQGIFRHNAPLAQAWLDSARKVKATMSRKDWDAKALGAIALAKGENTQAQELLKRYLTSLDRLPASGMIAAERRRTADLLHSIAV